MLAIRLIQGETDSWITDFISTLEWSGSARQASRRVNFTAINNPLNKDQQVNIKLGDLILVYAAEGDTPPSNKNRIFEGIVTSRERTDSIGTVTYEAKDYMHYLIRSTGSYNFKGKNAETITKMVCDDLDIPIGDLYKTKKKISSLLCEDMSYYNIIMKAYTKASKMLGDMTFMLVMKGRNFCVIAKNEHCGVVLSLDADITAATYKENTDNMVNRVVIYKKSDKKKNDEDKAVTILKTVSNTKNEKKYGIYQSTYTQEDNVDYTAAAKALLQGVTKEANVTALGNLACVSGYAVSIRAASAGLNNKTGKVKGVFYIESDSHKWQGGVHTMDLTLTFADTLEEVE